MLIERYLPGRQTAPIEPRADLIKSAFGPDRQPYIIWRVARSSVLWRDSEQQRIGERQRLICGKDHLPCLVLGFDRHWWYVSIETRHSYQTLLERDSIPCPACEPDHTVWDEPLTTMDRMPSVRNLRTDPDADRDALRRIRAALVDAASRVPTDYAYEKYLDEMTHVCVEAVAVLADQHEHLSAAVRQMTEALAHVRRVRDDLRSDVIRISLALPKKHP